MVLSDSEKSCFAMPTVISLKRESTGFKLSLIHISTIFGRYERANGRLDDMEVSDEINACSVEIEVDVNGVKEPWLLMFKNETHNHPTEIEPFGGAATCIGGAIRDPLSGRSYVYQAIDVYKRQKMGWWNRIEKISIF